ncbi:MAG: amidohydrolase family protein [Candidatus Nanopelagicales bacterium]|nr:amidohydrolase family protein [Candidatus Nanopelagicales bacterium]MDZ4249968.1 amidohydrolase family protein [Candidatus Nanopelagicales bacterium]
MTRDRIAIDAWASWISPEGATRWPTEYLHIFRKYRSPQTIFEGMPIEDVLADMDNAGVDRCLLSAFYHKDTAVVSNEEVAEAVAKFPDRFVGSGTVNVLRKPLDVGREVEYLITELGMRAIRLEPYMYGDGMTGMAPNDKHYWPVYLKCAELGVPVCIQVGHTGPLLPSECGRPIYLDEVALAFPDLTIIGCHLGQPWHDEMMTLAWKHPNVYVETSARTPKHWPASFTEFVRGWGQDKVLWATDYPLLSFDRTLSELEDLGLGETIYTKVVRDNALRAFRLTS